MMNLNLTSAFLLTKYVIPAIKASKHGGKIVHISSMTGLNANGLDSAYAASKAGLIRLVESASQEVKNDEINVNCILPSIIDTEANRKAMPNEDFSKWVKPHDLANIILFLCSEYGKAITGAAIPTRGYFVIEIIFCTNSIRKMILIAKFLFIQIILFLLLVSLNRRTSITSI